MPGYDGKVMQLRLPKEHWWALEEISARKRGCESNVQAPEQIQNFRAYLRAAMHRLATQIPADLQAILHDETIIKTNNNFPIPEEDRAHLELLATRFGISVPRLCTILIIHPMLREYYDIKGF